MDLDFSFALVSSLTPRRKAEKSCTTEVSKKTNSLKNKLFFPKSQNLEEFPYQRKEEKENKIPKEQLMNKDEFFSPSSNNVYREESIRKSDFSINMENIAVRRHRTRSRKKIETSPLQPCDNVLETSNENKPTLNLSNERLLQCVPDVINISSDDENCLKTSLDRNKSKEVRPSRKSHLLTRVSDSSVQSSPEVVESSCSEVKGDSIDNCKSLRSLSVKKRTVKTRPTRTSGKSETSLSTAYDSDSFHISQRHGTKVIPETPETDKSSGEGFNEKRKSSILSVTSEKNIQTQNLRNCETENLRKITKRKSSELSDITEENKKRIKIPRPSRKSSLFSYTSEKNQYLDVCASSVEESPKEDGKLEKVNTMLNNLLLCDISKPLSSNEREIKSKKILRKNNDSAMCDLFKLESTIKDQFLLSDSKSELNKTKLEASRSTKNDNKNIATGKDLKVANNKIPELEKKRRSKEKEATDEKKYINEQRTDNFNKEITKKKLCSPKSPKLSMLVLPAEMIPKFEHINQWLQDSQEKIIGSLNTECTTGDTISKKDLVTIKSKYKVSLSPRIKKKKDKAKSSLEEEQKLFEELYGAGYEKRLSDDVDEVTSRLSSQDSVEFSENVLDKLYGSLWQKNTADVKSEPKKGRKKKNAKNKTPLTERKKHRTSIYEVFSSSSSEDRFEEFLENVQRGKVQSTKQPSGRPGTPDFINDSDSEDGSLVFYQNIVSSAVKDEINNFNREEINAKKGTNRVNRRRLSFCSSKDDGCSESGKSDKKPTSKDKKPSNVEKTKTKKSRSKKKTDNDIDEKGGDGIDVFSLVTPLKVKGKKAGNYFNEKSKDPEVPRSVGKLKTPKNQTWQKNYSNSEERLKNTYSNECDFKVPKSASKTFKTPTKLIKPDVPSSPSLSFLSSLSEMTAGLPCHPDALVYKKHFKNKREELTKRLFTLYNKEVFDNQLPADMLLQWSTRMTSTSGYCYNKRIYRDNQVLRSSRIVLSTKILDRADRLRDTLIHELCHAATWIIHAMSDGHGPIWRSWADKANRRFPELPVIKRCHDYAISTKFTYKCMSCGYSIGRHSKSLDTERKRCGFCFGKFQVFVTAKMSTASVTSGSDSVKTPRNPTGFALFVKENYALVKKENNVPHAQVMKLLGQKFAEVKISKQNSEEPIVIE